MNSKRFKTAAFMAFLKTLMMVFNLLFFLIGFSLIVVGLYGMKVFQEFFSFAPSEMIYYPLIFIGLLMMLIGALSFWCTPKGIVWLLNIYAGLIFLVFLSIFSFSVFFTVKHNSVKTTLKSGFEKSMKNYETNFRAIDILQIKFKCCGSDNYTDWFATEWANNQNNVPKSCCINKNHCINKNLDIFNTTDIYEQVCFKKKS